MHRKQALAVMKKAQDKFLDQFGKFLIKSALVIEISGFGFIFNVS
jgi:hypothetical protein